MSDLTTLTSQLASMKQRMIDRLTAQGVSGYTMQDTMEDIVVAYETLRKLDYCTDTITENGSYIAPNGKTGYNSFIVNVPAGGPATHKKYQLLDRVYEDINGDSIGIVCGFHYDANNTEYAIVCLDAQYRLDQGQYLSGAVAIANLPNYANETVFGAKETATFNCDKLLMQATASGLTSTAVSHCRAQTFIIEGNSYAGQLVSLPELLKVFEWRSEINTADPTASQYSTLIIPTAKNCITSTQHSASNIWYININGQVNSGSKLNNLMTIPVLEIPNVAVSE